MPLVPDGRGFAIDIDGLRRAITPRTKALIVNSPHNPTGMVATDTELRALAELAVSADLLVITDEVYEHLVFDGHRHLPLATYPGMAERTVTISSAAKMFNCTGWKIGWACGAPELIAGVRAAKQYLSYVGGAPFQPAVAQALNTEEAWVAALRESLQAKRDRLGSALAELGFEVHDSFGTYFLCADPRPLGYRRQHHVLRRVARTRRRGRDSDVGVLRPRRRARRCVESLGALRILQARRHPRRGDPAAGGAAAGLTSRQPVRLRALVGSHIAQHPCPQSFGRRRPAPILLRLLDQEVGDRAPPVRR